MIIKDKNKIDSQKNTPPNSNKETPLWERPGFLIRRLHQLHSNIFYKNTQEFNITPIQYAVLTIVDLMPNIDQKTLGENIDMDRTNIADVLLRLSNRGLINRTRNKTDKRMMFAKLTPEGARIKKTMYKKMEQSQKELLAPLTAEETSAFFTIMNKIINGSNL